ncbi:carbonic anhydrase [Klebsormidium nitens]|uniref:carbonic anhydrase n=1 Tax=Klebsormidium nitens TaxID=105231 RepID=A0A0U9HIF9_KLENI|nr:carbonic anhydrase [Klebsormidium nitens]|eukprot:GAQ79411.1 carbonic anhydrase [Klebsormidium nitens]
MWLTWLPGIRMALQTALFLFIAAVVMLAGGVDCDAGPGWNHILGGTDWAGLSAANAICDNGQKQSPVAIEDSAAVPSSDPGALIITWNSALIDFQVQNLGVTVQVMINGSNTLTVPSYIYTPPANSTGLTLAQFHFHTPSEYTLDGEYFPAEVHFVHKDPVTGQLAVIGVFFSLSPDDSDNPELGTFFPNITEDAGTNSEAIRQSLNLNSLLPASRSYYHLSGSLTTPPCSENVLWFVMKNPLDISSSQLMKLQFALAHGEGSRVNNRPVQPLNGRTIILFQGNVQSCDSSSLLPNQCYNAQGTTFVCCPGGCPSSPTSVPACA